MPIDDVEGQACAKCACLAKSPSGLNNSVLRIVFLCGSLPFGHHTCDFSPYVLLLYTASKNHFVAYPKIKLIANWFEKARICEPCLLWCLLKFFFAAFEKHDV